LRVSTAVLLLVAALSVATLSARRDTELWRDVEVIRTAHGVPHIRAANLRAAGYALAWVMSEDYGARTAMRLVGARGELSRFEGRSRVDADFINLRARARAIDTYHLLDQDTRDVYDGFAAGINRYVLTFPAQFPAGIPTDFSGYDVATLDIGDGPPAAKIRRFIASIEGKSADHADPRPDADYADYADGSDVSSGAPAKEDEGSNAWALAPSRTTSGRAILLRNPHLAWNAGYYEAHVTVPGVLDFYGDFRIGGPLIVIGGFNRNLGWATTNSNSGDLTEIYALDRDPSTPDRYLLDGASLPVARTTVTIQVRDGDTTVPETRDVQSTPLGPVIFVDRTKIYIARTAGDGGYRAGEQFLRMMRARTLAEWKDAMRIRGLVTSNFTYADRAGNIFYLWNAALPLLPHAAGGDTATAAHVMRDVWTQLIPFDALPQRRNPPGGYLHNENDSPHFANVRGTTNLVNAYPNIEPPMLRLRSQHAIELIGTNRKFSLEGVVRTKHSYRMLLADRVKPDLIAAVRATKPVGDVRGALALMRRWDNTSAPSSRGGVLFDVWFQRYSQLSKGAAVFAHAWSESDPLRTPRGLASASRAADAFTWAVEETTKRHGKWDVSWGDVHRVRRGTIDVPVGGCSGQLGCFRVLTFSRAADGKLVADGGDGWVLAVEFGATPRAYSVLAYGQSPNPESPWHADQAAMFATGKLKRVLFTASDVDAGAVTRYRPGER
jgi:acyl-homoserine-lactone acylase